MYCGGEGGADPAGRVTQYRTELVMLLDQLADPACPASPQLAGRADRRSKTYPAGLSRSLQPITIQAAPCQTKV